MPPRPATTVDLAHAAASLADAFIYDPYFTWVWPDPTTFASHANAWFSMVLGLTFPRGHTYVDDHAAITWIPPGEVFPTTDELDRALELLSSQIGDRAHDALDILARAGSAFAERPAHFHCVYVGVRTAAQKQGLGHALFGRTLPTCDRDGIAASVISTNIRNVPFYRSLGFVEVEGAEVPIPGTDALVRPMWREPRT